MNSTSERTLGTGLGGLGNARLTAA
jgi:hypothetical protein